MGQHVRKNGYKGDGQVQSCDTLFLWMWQLWWGYRGCLKISSDWSQHPQTRDGSLGSDSSLFSVGSGALQSLLLDAQLEGFSHEWLRGVWADTSSLTLPGSSSYMKEESGSSGPDLFLERWPALSLDNTLTDLRGTHNFLPVPVIAQVSP